MGSRDGEFDKFILESVEIDKMSDEPPHPQNPLPPPLPPLSKSGSKRSTFQRIGSSMRSSKRNGVKGVDPKRVGRQQSGALRGLNSLRFIEKKKIGKEGDGWKDVENRFNQMAVEGRLSRDKFGICVGMGDSREFAGELYGALGRRRDINTELGIDLDTLRLFWEDIALQDSDTRLHIFFDM